MEQTICNMKNENHTDLLTGVITADIVGSTKIPMEHRKLLLGSLHQLESQLQSVVPFKMEVYRGDSFQIVVGEYDKAILLSVLIRAGLKMSSPAGQLWDARLSVGVGKTSYEAPQISVSDGEAFRFSGRGLDALGKKRLSVTTVSQDVNDELAVLTAFADDIITHWTPVQSSRVFDYLLSGLSQKELAIQKGITQQVLNKTLRGAKYSLISLYLKRANFILTQLAK